MILLLHSNLCCCRSTFIVVYLRAFFTLKIIQIIIINFNWNKFSCNCAAWVLMKVYRYRVWRPNITIAKLVLLSKDKVTKMPGGMLQTRLDICMRGTWSESRLSISRSLSNRSQLTSLKKSAVPKIQQNSYCWPCSGVSTWGQSKYSNCLKTKTYSYCKHASKDSPSTILIWLALGSLSWARAPYSKRW